MANTLGDFIDQLTIANIRLWMLEDNRREYCETDQSKSEQDIKDFLRKISQTNKERNALIDKINASLAVLISKAADKDSTLELDFEEILGTGKNKFYKKEEYE